MHTHEHYEVLCALAATGQVPEDEKADLQAHLADCPGCRSLIQEFAQLGSQLLSRAAEEHLRSGVPEGMTERFVARARSEGLSVSRNVVPEGRGFLWWPGGVAAAALAATLVLAAILGLIKLRRPALPAAGIPATIPQATASAPTAAQVARSRETGQPQAEQLRQQLTEARAKVHTLESRIQATREALAAATRDAEALRSELQRVEQENSGLKASQLDRAAQITKLEGEIDKLSSLKTASDVALSAQENELRTLRQSLAEREAALRQQQHLVDVGNQVRDLIVARNFHVFDVYDWDEDGNKQRAFGRIFYTEGKSLIFYAYDLADPRKIDRQVSFYAWGERLGGNSPVKRLGIFHSEDVNEGRWVLTFDDPRVLAQINSVFVTVEDERKAVTHPRGKRMLSAFLGNTANHP